MTSHSGPVTTTAARRPRPGRVDVWIGISAACLVTQSLITDYGSDTIGPALSSIAVGAVLLVLVRLRSRVARGIVVVLSSTGAVIYLLTSTSPRGFALALLFAGQAAALVTPSVRRHVRTRRG